MKRYIGKAQNLSSDIYVKHNEISISGLKRYLLLLSNLGRRYASLSRLYSRTGLGTTNILLLLVSRVLITFWSLPSEAKNNCLKVLFPLKILKILVLYMSWIDIKDSEDVDSR